MGQLDELTTGRVEHDIQTVNSANTELKQQIRQLNADCRQLEDKLAAARSNNRFLDKRVAALEAQLLEQAPAVTPRR
jgi:chromosome segregation ATPase